MKKMITKVGLIILSISLLSGCYLLKHRPGSPAELIPTQKLNRPRTLEKYKMYVDIATAKGEFTKNPMQHYRYDFQTGKKFILTQMANLQVVAEGTYQYHISKKYPRESVITMHPSDNKFTYLMRLNFYNNGLGYYRLWRLSSPSRNMQTGIFKLVPETYKI